MHGDIEMQGLLDKDKNLGSLAWDWLVDASFGRRQISGTGVFYVG
jgi:hypothetical protein